ncbi:hypothetical protein WJX72_005151 [[Myrmecia] bisecta]|uniref:Thioesterase domain-containing protein n=1 Tax=[Myrmecia] bisecta TaxID=41462 RepID=A0AAW1QF28_9CHLO
MLSATRRFAPLLPRAVSSSARYSAAPVRGKSWTWLKDGGHRINPCNSPLHPAVVHDGLKPEGDELPVQEAYTPQSQCWGCGPAAPDDGLKLRSYRIPGGLQANIKLAAKYQAFPGIMNGGVISSLFDCHGNWTAAIALMDRSSLPRPPLTLTAEMLVQYKEPTPPNVDLVVRSQVVQISDSTTVAGKATVQVDITLHKKLSGGAEKLLAQGSGVFKKLGALRAL